jgi:N-acetylglucosaminyldiphosphoundecaprenol N-acetyl-beta-D-mannosaminyltransferase
MPETTKGSDQQGFVSKSSPDRILLMGIPIDRVTEEDTVNRIVAAICNKRGGWVATPNVDHLRQLALNPNLRALVTSADLIVADGMPLVWASRLQGTPLPCRVSGSAIIFRLSEAAAQLGASVYLLGGNPGTAEKAGELLAQAYPGLTISGTLCPSLGFDTDEAQLASICKAVSASKPDIVYSCFGFPKQEKVIQRLRESLPTAWFLGLGGSLSIVSGEIERAPLWMQRVGLEWCWRLIKEPRRLARRYLVHDLPFAFRFLLEAWGRRFRARETLQSSETSIV